jgi:hypothetical protein
METKNVLVIGLGVLVLGFLLVYLFGVFNSEESSLGTGQVIGGSSDFSNLGEFSFFITSSGLGDGANLGGLSGADAHCQSLASEVGFGDKTWKAYLSTTGENGIDARDRIGMGPWYNVNGVLIANDVENLHGENNLNKETALDERGEVINGRGDDPNMHDILTGSDFDGRRIEGVNDTTCNNWMSNSVGSAMVGHHDRIGLRDDAESRSWVMSHLSRGCSQENLQSSGGDGLFYCFAVD